MFEKVLRCKDVKSTCLLEKDYKFKINAFLFKRARYAQPAAHSLPVSNPCNINHVRLIKITAVENQSNIVKCNECDWTSTNQSQLPGHIVKHGVGQYVCRKCKIGYKTKTEMNEYMQSIHKPQESSERLVCFHVIKNF